MDSRFEHGLDRVELMKAYLITTGVLFGLITVAHVLRMIDEGAHLMTDPFYLLLTAASAALCVWALRLFRRSAWS